LRRLIEGDTEGLELGGQGLARRGIEGENPIDVFHDMSPGLAECGFGRFFGRPYDSRPDISLDVPEFSADTGTGAGYDAAQGL